MKEKRKYVFEWANGFSYGTGKSVEEACKNIAKSLKKVGDITTGFLVRLKFADRPKDTLRQNPWRYWDSEMFWKYLKEGVEKQGGCER